MKARPIRAAPTKRLLAFLSDARSYPGHPARVRLLQTHASWVALTPRFAYKVKKSINFGFLNFSTLEKRRHFCEREIVLNQRLSQGVYLGVVPISRKGNRLAFSTDGEIIDYAIKMRRLSARHFMLRMLECGQVIRRDLDLIVARLKTFYRDQSTPRNSARWGRVTNLKISTDENFRQVESFVGLTITRPAFDAIRCYTDRFYHDHACVFAARAREGRIRDCHGDLHLDHIHLNGGAIVIYDCIEFNDRFRLIDVANDVAFLAMDLDFHERPDLATYFVTRMAKALADPGVFRVLDFYKCYRAFVRGKVESLRHSAPGISTLEKQQSRNLAERYFQLALRYAVSGSEPMVLISMGRVASGKSTLTSSLGRELAWKTFSSDCVRKELAGIPLHVRVGAAERLLLYSRAMSDRTYAALTRYAIERIRNHESVILDATFAERGRREALRGKLAGAGIKWCFIEARSVDSAIRRRLCHRAHVVGEVSDARLEDFPSLNQSYQSPAELASLHFFAVDTVGAPARALSATLKNLALRRAASPQ